jgi:hypothetical protein
MTIALIKSRIDALAAKIGAPADLLPTYGSSRDFAHPHVEYDGRYHFVVVERGQELQRHTSLDIDDILYAVFEGITHSMASNYELHHRDPGRDNRPLLFAKQLELLGALDTNWSAKCAAEVAEILAKHPFKDK